VFVPLSLQNRLYSLMGKQEKALMPPAPMWVSAPKLYFRSAHSRNLESIVKNFVGHYYSVKHFAQILYCIAGLFRARKLSLIA